MNGCAIFILNLFLGWTIIGWIIALVWAFCQDVQQVEILNNAEEENEDPIIMDKYLELEKLAGLKEKGIITEEDFIAQKNRILGTKE